MTDAFALGDISAASVGIGYGSAPICIDLALCFFHTLIPATTKTAFKKTRQDESAPFAVPRLAMSFQPWIHSSLFEGGYVVIYAIFG